MIKRTEAITRFWEAVVRKCSVTKVFLEISQNSQENTCARVSFIIKMQVWPATLLKKRLWHRCLPVNFVKSLRTPYLQNTCGGCFWFFLIGPWFIRIFRLWNFEKCFLFHLKRSFPSRDIQIFVIFSLPFYTFQIQKDKWKWNNLCYELACINLHM